MITRRIALFAAAVVLAGCQSLGGANLNPPVPPIPAHIAAAVASDDRTEAMKARDPGRKPAEVFALAGLEPGDRVIEIGSFGQYDTTIMAGAVGPQGRIYMYDLPYMQQRAEAPSRAFVAAHPNTEYAIGKFDELTFPQGVDMVVIDMYYHDLAIPETGDIDMARFNRMMFDALRPGGRMLIVDHNAEPGSGRRDIATIHRIDRAVIVDEVTDAGFKLIIDSDLFANPDDDRSLMVFAPGERGSTDRSLLVFEKPN
jgi:predicted methyltransferase